MARDDSVDIVFVFNSYQRVGLVCQEEVVLLERELPPWDQVSYIGSTDN